MNPTGQMPPFDADAEAAVLSAALIRGHEAVDEVGDIVFPEHFYSERHRRIFEAASDLAAKGEPVDLVSVASWLRAEKRLEQVGGMGYLIEVANAAPAVTAEALRHYATTIRERATLRSVLATCQVAAAAIYGGVAEPTPFLQELESALHSATMERRTANAQEFKDLVRTTFESMTKRAAAGERIAGHPTGFTRLDESLAGLHGGDLTILAARPGMGKTSLAMNIAMNVARRGLGVVVFSLEMPGEQLASRALCSEARVDVQKVRTGKFVASDWSRLTETIGVIGAVPLTVVDTADLPLAAMRTILRRKQSELTQQGRKLGLVVIDYLQLMTGKESRQTTRDQQLSEITRGLKATAKEADVPVMALSQLNREVEKRSDKRPQPSDLRESGAIEQDADNILFIYRDDYYDADSREPNIAEVIIAKQRNGPTGTVKLRFDGAYTRFDNLASGEWDDAAQ